MMDKIDKYLDWIMIVSSPVFMLSVIYTDDIVWLRLCAGLWLISIVTQAISDRLKSRAKRVLMERRP